MRPTRFAFATRTRFSLLACAVGAVALIASTGAAQNRSRNNDEPFRWTGDIQPDRWVYVNNVNGAVRVEASSGSKVEVTATKHWHRGNPDNVRIVVQQVGSGKGDILLCALFTENSTCDEDGVHGHRDGWSWRGNNNNDVSVEFIVRVPAGVRLNARTVNGGIEIDGATSLVNASTVNGSVQARSSGGPVRARTTNGNIDVRAGAFGDERLDYETTNGSITVELPASANAEIDMRTVNGSISSDFPLTVQGRIDRRHLQATLGKGGPSLRLTTVNGSVRLRRS